MGTLPIRSKSARYDIVPLFQIPDIVHNGIVPEAAYPTLDRTDIVQYGTSLNQDLVPITVPIRLDSVQYDIVPPYDTVPPSVSHVAVHYDTVPEILYANLKRTDTEKYDTLFNLDYVPVTVPSSFVQG